MGTHNNKSITIPRGLAGRGGTFEHVHIVRVACMHGYAYASMCASVNVCGFKLCVCAVGKSRCLDVDVN